MSNGSYTRDWLENTPADHSTFGSQPGGVRQKAVDVAERLKAFFYGFTSGETTKGLKYLECCVQTTAPSSAADALMMYCKDVTSKGELHVKDEDGNEIQITSKGKINLDAGQLTNDTTLKALNAAGTGQVDVIKVNTADLVVIPYTALLSATTGPSTDAGIVNKAALDAKFNTSTGHDHDGSDSKQIGASGVTAIIGTRVSKSNDTSYLAETDGEVEAWCVTNSDSAQVLGYCDGNNPPTTEVRGANHYYPGGSNKRYPLPSFKVKKGQYWKVTGCTNVNWIPLGS